MNIDEQYQAATAAFHELEAKIIAFVAAHPDTSLPGVSRPSGQVHRVDLTPEEAEWWYTAGLEQDRLRRLKSRLVEAGKWASLFHRDVAKHGGVVVYGHPQVTNAGIRWNRILISTTDAEEAAMAYGDGRGRLAMGRGIPVLGQGR